MRENKTEVAVGAIVLAAAAGFLWFILSATGGSRGTGDLTLHANFRSAEGVTVGTDIRLAGVSIGTVSALSLNPETYRAEAAFAIDDGIGIPDDSAAVVASEGLLGGTYVEIVPGGSFEMFADGALIEDTQGAVGLIQLLMKFVDREDS
ncbi:outer membrane lipid asymmetry maintenance protein MlaD [Thalassorhabdomicrobium marinisediminis]|uniref:Outer membrane lipid asymmetry maintenance protein MlaD n=1 Tax=Thalassorhabdomicrobium marinisediminis TaxID=2170577 RepID=A0A2T7FY14_9RHOB|nr:outer membrane lipid asymmetry maintenance protein MlaD [Thalassorhabdomicrobium marinisediminis]PVA07061.1 outer membrane lipid asymmetry maintenance protein MlaD [Thalassorhabdomicrobium marinisediminis]